MTLVRLIALALLACAASSCLPHHEQTPGGPEALKVTAEPPRGSVASGKAFAVRVRVENTSPAPLNVAEWNCSREKNWRTDNPRVRVPARDCWRNFVETVVLQPGEGRVEEVELEARSMQPEETFRVGFTSSDGKRVCWSNPVVIRPTP